MKTGNPEAVVSNTRKIKQKARELGFLDCGITRAEYLPEDASRLESWLQKGFHGEMDYMQNHFEMRADPRLVSDGARSVIMVLQNYHTRKTQSDPQAPRISKYAYGKDYHRIIRRKLKTLMAFAKNELGARTGRIFVDSAPVLERPLARNAGLGWIGKHSLLLNRKYGSFFFIGGLITDLVLEYDSPVREYCGDCTRCIDACPTGAIVRDKIVDSRRCISYLTIEYKGERLPEAFRSKMNNQVFGCDICQDVCPWNHHARPHNEPGLEPLPGLMEMSLREWLELDEEKYHRVFAGSAVKRLKFPMLKRNVGFLSLC